MTLTVTAYLGLQLAVPGTKEPFNTGIYNSNLTKLENRLQTTSTTASNASGTASAALTRANDAYSVATGAQGIGNNAQTAANTAQARADDAWSRTDDIYTNKLSGIRKIQTFAGVITPSALNTNTTLHVGWSFPAKPVATVTPETGAADKVRMTLTNISATGCDVVINRSDNTAATGYNIIAAI